MSSKRACQLANSLAVEAPKLAKPGKKWYKDDFGTIKIRIFCRITYPKSSQILFGETFLWVITFR
jgi:hypothetical protein